MIQPGDDAFLIIQPRGGWRQSCASNPPDHPYEMWKRRALEAEAELKAARLALVWLIIALYHQVRVHAEDGVPPAPGFGPGDGGSNAPPATRPYGYFVTRQEWRRRMYAAFHGRCWYCGIRTVLDNAGDAGRLRPDSATVDHVVPRSQGGERAYDNLVLACHDCNAARGDATFAVFSAFWRRVYGPFCWWPNRRAQSRYRRCGKHAPFHVKKPPMTPNPKPAEALG